MKEEIDLETRVVTYVPNDEVIWDYVIQRMNELQSELMILEVISKKLGISDGRQT